MFPLRPHSVRPVAPSMSAAFVWHSAPLILFRPGLRRQRQDPRSELRVLDPSQAVITCAIALQQRRWPQGRGRQQQTSWLVDLDSASTGSTGSDEHAENQSLPALHNYTHMQYKCAVGFVHTCLVRGYSQWSAHRHTPATVPRSLTLGGGEGSEEGGGMCSISSTAASPHNTTHAVKIMY